MSGFDLEYQEKIPVFILNPAFKYLPDGRQLQQLFESEGKENLNKIIIDLSSLIEVNSEFFHSLRDFVKYFKSSGRRLGLVIQKEVKLEGLRIKLIDELLEIFETKYDAVYNFLN